MEAKDTVMSDEELKAIDITKFYNEKSSTLNFIEYQRATALAQAEISFKAGKQETMKEIGNTLDLMQHIPVEGIPFLVDVRMSKEYIEDLKSGKYRIVIVRI